MCLKQYFIHSLNNVMETWWEGIISFLGKKLHYP
jgi:hypothetical protein